MYGAILGDIIGSPYEFTGGTKTKEFSLFAEGVTFTDDTVMTLAVADAFMDASANVSSDEWILQRLTIQMRYYGRKYPNAGYGHKFGKWLKTCYPKPYNSFGNGSAMRVSSVAWLYHDLQTVRKMARLSATVTHNHPEGIKGAEAVASAIFLARNGFTKAEIKTYVENNFDYDLSRSCDEIRPAYAFEGSCQKSVPEAIIAFLESDSFEDAIRTAVSLGGDTDTQAAIAGSIAEAYYGVPEALKAKCREYLPELLLQVLIRFEGLQFNKCGNEN